MIANKCFVCGSFDLRADRALSGRLVCNSCGTPLGIRRTGNKKINHSSLYLLKNKYFLFVFILIFAFVLVII